MTGNLSLMFALRVFLVALLSTPVTITQARAHEVQPAVMDIEMSPDAMQLFIEWIIEAPVAGLDLDGLENTNEADNEGDYLRLRTLPPADMEEAFRVAWPVLLDKITLRAGETELVPVITDIDIPPVGNIELPRTSTIELHAPLPPGDDPLVIGWTADLGPLVVRQRTVEGGYAGYLTSGALSDPIPRTGTTATGPLAAFTGYTAVGYDHIVPKGLDHILFVLGLFFFSLRMGPLLWQVSAFTLAHTVTLALGALNIVRIPADIVEPLIAASIVYVGVENVLVRRLPPWRPVVVFGFGLLHGLGFAAVLRDFGLSADNFIPKLIGFNVGVEIGQLSVIAAAWLTLAAIFGGQDWYHRRIAAPVSVAIAVVAAFWVLERTATIDPTGPWSFFSNLTEGGFPPFWTLLAALLAAAALTALVLAALASDTVRDGAGMATSAVMFLAVIATFTSTAWTASLIAAAAWVLALRVQSLGGPDPIHTT